jgi:alpha-1,2-mannosyltransferase
VELLENAPYSEIVRRLGEASIGLNTMQDEHFGINVVEFMVRHLLLDLLHPETGLIVGCWIDPYRSCFCWTSP